MITTVQFAYIPTAYQSDEDGGNLHTPKGVGGYHLLGDFTAFYQQCLGLHLDLTVFFDFPAQFPHFSYLRGPFAYRRPMSMNNE